MTYLDSSLVGSSFANGANSGAQGLPYQSIPYGIKAANQKRSVVNWFVPEFGVVAMYVSPESIQYNNKKIISKQLTKGGYLIQYWGEDLTEIDMRGTTGSSGVEGLNLLHEVYRAEQLSFDAVGLNLATAQTSSGLSSILGDAGSALSGAGTGGSSTSVLGSIGSAIGGGILDADATFGGALPQNTTTLVSMALGVEMYFNGWVFRGYFTSMNWTESTNFVGGFDYTIHFVVTQRRGYRTNNMPWQRTPTLGPSNNGYGGIPLTFQQTAQATNLMNPGRLLAVNNTSNTDQNGLNIGGVPVDVSVQF
jgi:hypothetical protein